MFSFNSVLTKIIQPNFLYQDPLIYAKLWLDCKRLFNISSTTDYLCIYGESPREMPAATLTTGSFLYQLIVLLLHQCTHYSNGSNPYEIIDRLGNMTKL